MNNDYDDRNAILLWNLWRRKLLCDERYRSGIETVSQNENDDQIWTKSVNLDGIDEIRRE